MIERLQLADNVGIVLIPHLMLDDSVSNLIMSSTSRSKGIDNIMSELNNVFKQLTARRSKFESLASSLSKHDDLKQEVETLSPLKLLLSKDIVPAELDDIIKAESVIDFIANEVTKRIISRNNMLVYNIPDRIPIETCSAIPTKNANLSVMSVVTSDSQSASNDVINLIIPSLPLAAHKQIFSSNATTLKNAVKIKKPSPRKKNDLSLLRRKSSTTHSGLWHTTNNSISSRLHFNLQPTSSHVSESRVTVLKAHMVEVLFVYRITPHLLSSSLSALLDKISVNRISLSNTSDVIYVSETEV
ncbi:unnamed protein product [Schistosoma margrebowiei]|uniref:Uncharacterized protein n=1 Tax=Schistosoma margrebowiei TaxID=48269 RepID=A0A183LHU2_9TREM|nr:unnamed protein product [Schistosoma margrebowiei]